MYATNSSVLQDIASLLCWKARDFETEVTKHRSLDLQLGADSLARVKPACRTQLECILKDNFVPKALPRALLRNVTDLADVQIAMVFGLATFDKLGRVSTEACIFCPELPTET